MPAMITSETTDTILTKLKVFCPQDELMKALTTVSRAVSTKSTLPVLNNILLAAEKVDQAGRLRLTATNLEISISMLIQAEVEQPGPGVLQ
jgi:DNA polymerase III subunit beta